MRSSSRKASGKRDTHDDVGRAIVEAAGNPAVRTERSWLPEVRLLPAASARSFCDSNKEGQPRHEQANNQTSNTVSWIWRGGSGALGATRFSRYASFELRFPRDGRHCAADDA